MRILRLSPAALLVAVCGALLPAPAAATTPAELFQSANSAYEQGKFQEAAETYEKILGYGVRDPRVLYNLANAYFKIGRLGAAILDYERAIRLDPTDRDARDNLELARGLIRDRVEESELPYPVKVVKDVLDRFSVNAVTAVFLVFYVASAGLLGMLPLLAGENRRRLLGYGAAGLGLCALLAGGALIHTIQDRTAAHAVVMTDRADVLSGPSADNTVLFTVHEGTRLEVRNQRDGWYQVSLPNALSGWVPARAVERV